MTSRTRELAAEPAQDLDLAALAALYARHAPGLERMTGDHWSVLLAAARAHLRLAGQRAAGEPLIRVRDPEPGAVEGPDYATARPGPVVEIVTDDMPFLVEFLLAAVARAGGDVRHVIHPIVVVRRAATGQLVTVLTGADPAAPPSDALVESWIHLDLAPSATTTADLERELSHVLREVREVVEDATSMVRTARELADMLPIRPVASGGTHPADVARLLRWLADGHLTFLGYRYYAAVSADTAELHVDPASGLGVLRRGSGIASTFAPSGERVDGVRDLLVVTRASAPSPLHSAHPYYVAVATMDAAGRLLGEHRFLGSLTVPALHESILDIPVIDRRVRAAIHRAGFPLESYSGQQMLDVLSGLPREELFGADEQRLHDTAVGVLAVAGRHGVRLFLRPDPYHRFLSCLVYLPRDEYTSSSRLAMADVLVRRLGGRSVEHTARLSESSLALVHFTVHADADAVGFGDVDVNALQAELTEAVRTWDERLLAGSDVVGVAALLPGVPAAYKAAVAPEHAVEDLRRIAALTEPGDFDVRLHPASGAGDRRFTLYLAGAPATLTGVLPLLQQLGVDVLDERPSEFVRADGLHCWLYDFGLRLDDTTRAAIVGRAEAAVESGFCSAFRAAWCGDAETDRFSALVLRAGLAWREIAVLRAYARYARQLGSPYAPQYMANTLLAQPDVARGLLALFRARFDPAVADRETATVAALAQVRDLIDAVTGLDADRILRGFLAMITATLRTNWFRGRPYFSFKIDPTAVPDMPVPRPMFEIFVYSPRVEGVHLRFGPVARGGLRYSDRPQDYRTEILGLVKTQAVKNAVIVPVGAKGGFVVRRADAGPDEVDYCYRMFVSGLLEVTDNLVATADATMAVAAPPEVVRHDGDDSYLVVAADKGTARFSDTANEVAASYGFWLGDAFASGGSVGYDHKAMGITAKGAWESVKRHFHELGIDTQRQGFTVVGVGDMSGDVFGNGMLASRHIRLVAVFDHRHVFLDPTPDAARSFAERERLFALPGSSWDDYDRSVLSPGGGVWPRTAKSVPIGPEIRTALGLADDVTSLSPPELIAAILRAPADLLWNGGIGTYVKASEESHADVGDKANDDVRVDGAQLRVMVVGEGGNLGLTQRGRIEFARRGGKINTDAIDNSAGVDCSDHEVNIKILLDRLVAEGELNRAGRNALLASMTDEVAELVLADNRDQNAVLGIARAHAPAMANVHRRLVADLVARRGLDRELEVLPEDAGFAVREAAGLGLTSPELATLLAHTKLDLTAQVLATDLPDAAAFAARLPDYFPHPLRERFAAAITRHPLRREIVTTLLVNEMVDGAGMTYAFRLGEELSAGPTDAVRAYAVTTAVFDLPLLRDELAAPDIPTAVSDAIVLESRRLLDRASRWFLTNRPQPLAVGAETARFAGTVRALRAQLPRLLRGRELAAVERYAAQLRSGGLGAACALQSAALVYGYGLLDVVELTELAERDSEPREPGEVAALYYGLSEHLGIDLALTSVSALERGDRWHALARLALRDDLYGALRAITLDVLREAAPGTPVEVAITQWEKSNASRLVRARAALHEVAAAGQLDLTTLSVVSRQLRGLAR